MLHFFNTTKNNNLLLTPNLTLYFPTVYAKKSIQVRFMGVFSLLALISIIFFQDLYLIFEDFINNFIYIKSIMKSYQSVSESLYAVSYSFARMLLIWQSVRYAALFFLSISIPFIFVINKLLILVPYILIDFHICFNLIISDFESNKILLIFLIELIFIVYVVKHILSSVNHVKEVKVLSKLNFNSYDTSSFESLKNSISFNYKKDLKLILKKIILRFFYTLLYFINKLIK